MLARWAKIGLVLSITAVVLAGCAQEPAQKVNLSKVQKDTGASSQNWTCMGCKTAPQQRQETTEQPSHWLRADVIRVAVSSMTMPRETLGLYEALLGYVGDKLGKRVELVQRRTYREANDLVKAELVDVAFVCSLPYVLGHEDFGMELLVAPEVEGGPIYRSYIVVRADSGIDSFEELRGKTFAFTDPESNTGRLYPRFRLAQIGESPDSFFHSYIYTYAHDSSIRAVLHKTVDGAAVESLIFDYMAAQDSSMAANLKVIERSPPFGIPPVVVHPALEPQLKEDLRNIFLNMDKDERGRAILRQMNVNRFVLVGDEAYDSIREMYRQVQIPIVGQ